MVKRVSTIRELRLALETWRRRDESVGFVPTMGTLHAGHMALLRQAQSLATRVVLSIFVNPMQFGPQEDFASYPRQLEQDEKLLSENGCDLLFTPTSEEMYPAGFATQIDPGPIATILEGAFRPGHFIGVSTVVTKLLMQVMPDYAFFGEKDYQQLKIVEQIVRDLHIPVNVMAVPISRDNDGLALSSRNIYLTPDERRRAIALPEALQEAVEHIRSSHDINATLMAGQMQLEESGFKVDYFELVDARKLTPVRDIRKPARLVAAARIGKTRLIDNMPV